MITGQPGRSASVVDPRARRPAIGLVKVTTVVCAWRDTPARKRRSSLRWLGCVKIARVRGQVRRDLPRSTLAAALATAAECGHGDEPGLRSADTPLRAHSAETGLPPTPPQGTQLALAVTRVRGLARDPKLSPLHSRCQSICGSAHPSVRSLRAIRARRPNASLRLDARSAFRCRLS